MLHAETPISVRVPALTNEAVNATELKLVSQPWLEVLQVGIASRPMTAAVDLRRVRERLQVGHRLFTA
jgi:hypothetical protein